MRYTITAILTLAVATISATSLGPITKSNPAALHPDVNPQDYHCVCVIWSGATDPSVTQACCAGGKILSDPVSCYNLPTEAAVDKFLDCCETYGNYIGGCNT